ncbi:MAG: histidine kinase dimerization/phospho-acceptor domain-containing protein, partial [Pseudomonadota bacterium]
MINILNINENAAINENKGKGGKVKRLMTTAAVVLALGSAPIASAAEATQPAAAVAVEATMQDAFDTMVADSKSQMMRDPAAALEHASGAENLARSAARFDNRNVAIATAMWLKGEALFRAGKPEEGAEAISSALDLIGDEGLKSKLGGDLLLAHGRISSRLSDVKSAVKSFFKAHEVFVGLNEPRSEAMALMAIGSIYRDAQAYDRALDFYARASEVYEADDVLALSAFNNQGNILKELERFEDARGLFKRAQAIAEQMESPVLQARILTNVSDLEALDGNYAKAEAIADEALAFLDGDSGTEWSRFVYGAKALARLRQGDAEGAEALIETAFADVDIADTSMSYEEMHDVAYQVYLMRGAYGKALGHHESFKRLSDNAKKIASSANLAILGAQFHSAEQELNIARLKNEQMNKDMLLENARRQMTTQIAVMAVGGLILFFSLAGLVALRNHRNRVARINKQLQATVDRLNSEIARREIVERDLVKAKDVAEQANRMKSTFLATMSHELRTPMNGILGFSKILLAGDLSEEQRDHLEIIEQSGHSLLTLINDILDISQIEAGKLKLTTAPFNLRSTVEAAVKLLKAKAQEKNLSLAVHIDPAVPAMVDGDADRIRQIV